MLLSSNSTTPVPVLDKPVRRLTKWLVLALWLIAAVAAVPLAGKLGSVSRDDVTVELPIGAAATTVAALASRFSDAGVSSGIIVYARAGGLTDADRSTVDADRLALAALAADGDVAPGAPSRDGQAMTLTVPLRAAGSTTVSDLATKVRAIVDGGLPAGLDAKLTGAAGASLDAADARAQTAAGAMLVTAIVVTVILLVTYRSPVLWILPLLCVGVASVLTDAITYLLGRFAGMTVDTGNAAVVTVLVFGVGTDYALLLLARYREELRRTEDRHAAMARALRRAVPAIAASAATVSLALLCLLAADMGFNHTLGTAGAIAILCGLSTMVTLLPALLLVLGRWVFWPAIPRPGAAVFVGRFWSRIGRLVSARPRAVWVGTAAFLAVLAVGALGIHTGLDDQHLVVGNPDSVAGQSLLAAHYPAGRSRPVEIVAPSSTSDSLTGTVRGIAGVASVSLDARSTDGTLVRLDAVLTDPADSPAAASTVDRITAATAGRQAYVGGYTASSMAKAKAQAHDRDVVIPLVLLVVFAVLVLLLRSLVGPLLLMATVVLSYVAALGLGWLLFDHVFGFGALDVQLVLVGFLFLVALGVDYNIFLVTRIKEEIGRLGHREAVPHALAATGGVISSAGIVLAATFAALTVAPQVAFIEIGVLVAIGVLIDTLLVRSVLVPALVLDVGRRFWWPARA
jgi:RND superfamily putative drug exporter